MDLVLRDGPLVKVNIFQGFVSLKNLSKIFPRGTGLENFSKSFTEENDRIFSAFFPHFFRIFRIFSAFFRPPADRRNSTPGGAERV